MSPSEFWLLVEQRTPEPKVGTLSKSDFDKLTGMLADAESRSSDNNAEA